MNEAELLARINYNPQIFGGKAIIRGHRLAVEHVLGLLVAGHTFENVLDDFPWLERADIQACISTPSGWLATSAPSRCWPTASDEAAR